MYSNTNFKSKQALKQAVASGREVGVHNPGPFPGPFPAPEEGICCLEGPWYSKPHSKHFWHAVVTLKGGVIVKVK